MFYLKKMPLLTNMSTLQAFLGLVKNQSIYVHKWQASRNNSLKKMLSGIGQMNAKNP